MNPLLTAYSAKIPIVYDIMAIFGSAFLGYLFKKFANKGKMMIPFITALMLCFIGLRIGGLSVVAYFGVIAIVGFCLGSIFNTLAGLLVMQLTESLPQQIRTTKLGFYSAITMSVGNFTTALTQILIGFVIGKDRNYCDI